ncbi:hypothetical protein F8M49_20935 [Rhodococcus zopfii]|uniref:Uncharacterized protein n=1 Tax=Rhodococcus zopfii TaxID=43772 RepID=A0ABU3WV12_9NOCA|nr:hypothetical protein [Rhodococcus zopfii]
MAQCRDCNAEITWARTTGRGSFIPLDPYPDDRVGTVKKLERTDEHGHTHLVTDENGVVFADVLTGGSLHCAIANRDKLYVHTATPARPPPDESDARPRPPHRQRVRPSHRRRRW